MKGLRLAALAMALLAVGCSVILSTAEPTQCSADADCDANPSLRGRVCMEEFCVIPRPDGGVGKTDASELPCVSSKGCVQANNGQAYHCSRDGGVCTAWQTAGCRYPSGGDAWMSDNALVIGSIQPFTAKQSAGPPLEVRYAERIQHAIDLGLEEVAQKQPGGLVLRDGVPRPLAVIHCDSTLDPAGAIAAFKHLTGTVKVDAMIIGADDDLAAVAPLAIERGTAIVCSDCVAPFPPVPPAWRIIPPVALQAPMAAWRVADLEAKRKAEPSPPATLKVAVLRGADLSTKVFVDRFVEKVHFNGKSGAENLAEGDLSVIISERPSTELVDIDEHVSAITSLAPDVVVVAMGLDFPEQYLGRVEDRWPMDTPKPYYVITDLNYDVGSFEGALSLDKEELRRRISGTRNGFDPLLQDNITGFEGRYRVRYGGEPPNGNWSGYEAFYALLYAISAGSQSAALLDGPHISSGFEKLRSGIDIDLGPGDLSLGLGTLSSTTSTINVRGFWSSLDWNVTTHDLTGDISMFCFQRFSSGKLKINPNAGPHLITSTGVVSNPYVCD